MKLYKIHTCINLFFIFASLKKGTGLFCLFSCVPGNHGHAKDILHITNKSRLSSIRECI